MDNQKQDSQLAVKVLDRIISVSIGLTFFLIPVFFTGISSQGMGFDKMMLFYFLTLIGLVSWVTKGVIVGELALKRTPLDIPIIATLALFAVSTIFSLSQKDSLIGSYGNTARSLSAVIIFALFYYLLVNNVDFKKIKAYFWALSASASLVAVFSLLQLFKVYLIPAGFTHFSNFNPIGSLSGLTMYLVASLPVLIISATHGAELGLKNRIAKIVFGIMTAVALLDLALLNGFTFWPVAIATVVIALMFFLSKVVSIKSSDLFIPVGAFLVLVVLLVIGNFNLIKLDLPVEVSLSRAASWGIAKSSLKDNPLFGSGPSTFSYDFSKFKTEGQNYSPLWDVRFDNASGSVFEFLAGIGALGTLAVLVIVLIALSLSFSAILKTQNKEAQPLMVALFSGFVSVMIFSLLFTFNNVLIILAVIISALTTGAAIAVFPDQFRTITLSFRASANYALALAAVFLSVSAGVVVLFILGAKMFVADVYASQAMRAADNDQKIVKLSQASLLAPYQDVYHIELSKSFMVKANQMVSDSNNQSQVAANLNAAIEAGKAAVKINPNNAGNGESLALIYENASFYTSGALNLAEELYNNQIILEPSNPIPHLRMGLIQMAKSGQAKDEAGQKEAIEAAIKKYDEAIAKKSDFGAAYYGKAISLERLNRVDEAVDELKKAVSVAQDNLDYHFELGRMVFNRGVVKPNIAQTAVTDIAEGKTDESALSVSTQPAAGTVKRNDDLNMAEQIFKSIISAVPNNANSHYSLALLYQKIGEQDNAKAEVKTLLDLLPEGEQKEMVKKQFTGLY